jgi:hypothetical protein
MKLLLDIRARIGAKHVAPIGALDRNSGKIAKSHPILEAPRRKGYLQGRFILKTGKQASPSGESVDRISHGDRLFVLGAGERIESMHEASAGEQIGADAPEPPRRAPAKYETAAPLFRQNSFFLIVKKLDRIEKLRYGLGLVKEDPSRVPRIGERSIKIDEPPGSGGEPHPQGGIGKIEDERIGGNTASNERRFPRLTSAEHDMDIGRRQLFRKLPEIKSIEQFHIRIIEHLPRIVNYYFK